MLRKCTDEDINNEEIERIIDPFYKNFDEYIITYVMPEVIAFYIASSYIRNAMWEATFWSTTTRRKQRGLIRYLQNFFDTLYIIFCVCS